MRSITTAWNLWSNFSYFTKPAGDYPLDGGQEAEGSTLLNLRMGYDFSPAFNVTLDILNMLDSDDHDVEYFYESQLASETAPVEDRHFHVFEPRSFRVYLNYNF